MTNLSVVIPAYNEEKDIEAAVLDVMKYFPHAEILVVNDASTDGTEEILRTIQRRQKGVGQLRIITNKKNRGHGFSVISGIRLAKGNYILYIDADRQIDLKNLKGLQEADVISGWRYNRQDKPFRKFISFCLKATNLLWHHMYIKDANCPMKIYKKEAILPLLDQLPKTYIVPIACLEVLARKAGLRIVTIKTFHKPYDGVRKGFLQALNLKAMKFFSSAFFEVISL